jgi:formylglycine-generating enzyme required for sulfatase activity
MTTGSELGQYLQRRVRTYPESRQTPDFGTFAFDDRGELVIPLATEPLEQRVAVGELPPTSQAPIPPVPTRPSPPSTVPSSSPTPEPTEPASTQVTLPSPRTRRRKRSAPVVPLLPTREPNAASESDRSRGRRWIVLAAGGATLAIALIGYRIFGHEPSRRDPVVNTLPGVVADAPVDARPLAASAGITVISIPAGPVTGDCPAGMVPVPGETFRMGSPDEVGGSNEHPQHPVTLSPYCIDRTEVTVNAYAACVAAKGCTAAPLTVRWTALSANDVKLYSRFCNRADRADRLGHPINCVDWNQAAAYCKWADKRLPTEAEWEYAARGGDGRTYPWGNEAPSAKRLNACGPECVTMAKLNLHQDWGKMYDASDGWETTAPVGSFPDAKSPFGVLDMAGNVWEWTADWYAAYTNQAVTNPRGAATGAARVLRGGGWDNSDAASVRAAYRGRDEASDRRHLVGFRCARGD